MQFSFKAIHFQATVTSIIEKIGLLLCWNMSFPVIIAQAYVL